jgi:hypothetical protein
MAVCGEAVYDVSPENDVPTGKWNMNGNYIQCLNLGKEVGRLYQELSSVNKIIKLLKKDTDLIQRHANVSMIHDCTNTDRHNQNENIRNNKWQTVKDNKKWKNNRRNDIGKPQQITTIVNQ